MTHALASTLNLYISIQNGLKLIPLDHDVFEMIVVHVRVPVIELYLVSFDEPTINDEEYEDNNDGEDGVHSRID
jgi:hypothetical protein